jgi:hypothetical protein
MNKTLSVVSWFTLACACWLALMELLLRHPGYVLRVGSVAVIALISVATILKHATGPGGLGDRWLWAAGAIVLMGIGGQAFYRNVAASHFEGYVAIISVALVVQGLLMLALMIGARGHARPTNAR